MYYNFFTLEKLLALGASAIYRAILKYDYSDFNLYILEYCDLDILIKREQYFLDLLKPEYNILKVAGSRFGHSASLKTRETISLALLGHKLYNKFNNNIKIGVYDINNKLLKFSILLQKHLEN